MCHPSISSNIITQNNGRHHEIQIGGETRVHHHRSTCDRFDKSRQQRFRSVSAYLSYRTILASKQPRFQIVGNESDVGQVSLICWRGRARDVRGHRELSHVMYQAHLSSGLIANYVNSFW